MQVKGAAAPMPARTKASSAEGLFRRAVSGTMLVAAVRKSQRRHSVSFDENSLNGEIFSILSKSDLYHPVKGVISSILSKSDFYYSFKKVVSSILCEERSIGLQKMFLRYVEKRDPFDLLEGSNSSTMRVIPFDNSRSQSSGATRMPIAMIDLI